MISNSDPRIAVEGRELTTPSKHRPLRRIASLIVLSGVALLFASAFLNLAICRHLQSRNPVPGALYEVDGRAMHLYCSGQGSPTVVLESGRGSDWLYWQKVQPELSKVTRVCSYDRAGLGWSDPQPGERDAIHIADQLHSLLRQAHEVGPFVLAGASAGGLYVRQFAAAYPNETAGLVFVDASVPEQVEALPYGKDSEAQRRQRHREATWESIKEASGWARITGQCKGEVDKGLEAYIGFANAEACRPQFGTSYLGEWDDFWLSAKQAANARCCGDLPMLVISQDPDRPKPGWTAQQIAAQPIWYSLQEHLKALSPRSRRIVARGSAHHVMIDRPDVVVSGIRQLVTEIRSNPRNSQYGTTVVE